MTAREFHGKLSLIEEVYAPAGNMEMEVVRTVKNEVEQLNEVSILAKRNINDSVFTNLFKDTEYTLQLYKALHPEDMDVTEDEITIVTLENILLNHPYNDLERV